MRDQLIGYLLDALDPEEQELVEARLSHDPQLRRDLEVLSRALVPLAADRGHHEPPLGLAQRTVSYVAAQTRNVAPPPVVSMPARWSMADLAMAAGIFLAATLLFWPAMNQSRFAARLLNCQNQLRQIGVGLADYSELYGGRFPAPPQNSRLNWAGMYAVIMKEHGLLPREEVLICPNSPQAERIEEFDVPTTEILLRATEEQLARWRQIAGGSYGYSLGNLVRGQYVAPELGRGARYAIVADAPCPTTPYRHSLNHNGRGQNVLFADLHVQFLPICTPQGCNDHIFVNDEGKARAGLHAGDSVIGGSSDCPLGEPMTIGVGTE